MSEKRERVAKRREDLKRAPLASATEYGKSNNKDASADESFRHLFSQVLLLLYIYVLY